MKYIRELNIVKSLLSVCLSGVLMALAGCVSEKVPDESAQVPAGRMDVAVENDDIDKIISKAIKAQKYRGSDWQIPEDKSKFHIFLLMGQSNMAGGLKPRDEGYLLDEDKIPVPHILMIPMHKHLSMPVWKPAAHPLHLRGGRGGAFGLGLPFAKRYLEKNPGVTIGLIPMARGGHSIGRLNKGTGLYEEGMVKARFAAHYGTIKGVLWHQGESDRGPQGSFAYEGKLHTLVADLRRDLDVKDLPFIAGDLGEFSLPVPEGVARVRAALRSLPEKVPHTGFVESKGLKQSSRAHFDRAGYIELGHRYCDELLRVMDEMNKAF